MKFLLYLLRRIFTRRRKAFCIDCLPVGLLLSDTERTALYGEEVVA